MDLATLSTLAEQLAPLVLQKIKGKGKKEVSELTTVNDYENVKSLPAWYWNKQTGEKKAVNVSMADFQQHIQDVANQNLTDIKQEAEEANAAAQNSAESAAASAASAKASEDAALAQKNETVDYLNTVKANENERIASENARISAENARKEAELLRASQENTRITAEADRVKKESARVSAETLRAKAETARVNAENTRRTQEASRVSAEQTRVNEFATIKTDAMEATDAANTAAAAANTSANKANTAAANSDKQTLLCKSATDLAEELNAHPQMQGENGNWWKWNTETNEYEDTGIIARGGGMYPMVRSRRNHVIWYDSTDGFKERIVRRRNHTIIKL